MQTNRFAHVYMLTPPHNGRAAVEGRPPRARGRWKWIAYYTININVQHSVHDDILHMLPDA